MQFVVIYHLQATPTNLLALVSVKLSEKKGEKMSMDSLWELNLGSQHKRRGPLHHVPQCQVLNRTEMVPRGPSFGIGSAHAQKRPANRKKPPASPAIALA